MLVEKWFSNLMQLNKEHKPMTQPNSNSKVLSGDSKHTPTPWEVEKGVFNDKASLYITAPDTSLVCELLPKHMRYTTDQGLIKEVFSKRDANAAFIVKAVNSHEDFVNALKRISDGEFASDISSEDCLLAMRGVAREALKQAEA